MARGFRAPALRLSLLIFCRFVRSLYHYSYDLYMGGRASPVNALGHGNLRGGWRLVLPPWTAGAPLKRETCVQTTGAPIRRETCVLGLRLVLP